MAESGTYDLATIQRRQKIAEQMSADATKPRKIEHWMQGLAQLGEVGANEFSLNRLDQKEKAAKAQDLAALMSQLGGGAPAAAVPAMAPAVQPAPTSPAQPPPIAPSGGGVSDRIISAESGGDPNAKNPRSSATGAGQFIDSTWLETVKKTRPDLAAGKDDATLLAMRSDPVLSKEMTDAYATQNRSILGNAGLPVTPGATYLAHFAGPGGAQNILSADPKTQIAALLSPQAMQANPFLAGKTAGDVRTWADRKMGDGAPPTDVSAQNRPSGAPAVAQAMSPTAPAAAPAPAAASSGGLLANATPEQRSAIAKGLAASEGSPARALATSLLQKLSAPRDQWIDERGADGSFYQRNALTGERKVIEKSDVLPQVAVDQKIAIAKGGKPETTINNTVNPILHGVGERFNESMAAAKASVPQIEGIHEARKALDQGAITGIGADPQLFGAKVASLFGLGGDKASNTEVLRSSIGNSVLAKAKTLGANPSNADRDYIEKVVGGSIALEEKSVRRLLDMQEKWARDAIKRANADGAKLLGAQPKELAAVAPLLSVQEPEDYATFLKNNPIAAPAAAPTGGAPAPSAPGAVRKFNPATGKFE